MINSAFVPIVLAALSLTALSLTALSLAAAPPAQAAPDPDVKTISAASNDFGFRLLHLLATDATAPPDANVFFSPFSVSQALTLALSGAGGQTRDDMAKTLGLPALSQEAINAANARLLPQLTSDPKVQVSVANALWANTGLSFRPAFAADAEKFYNAPATTLNFQSPKSAATINAWVSKNTQGRITAIVAPADLQSATNILTNAVYFHGDWQTPFEPINTETKPFYLSSGGTKPVPLMERFDEMGYLDTPQFQIAALPYGTGRIVLLPKPGVTPETVALALSAETDAQWRGAMQPTDVMLYLPRFKADTRAELPDPLSTLGMGRAFGPDADLAPMTGRQTKLSAVLHIATVDVDEQGTIAAAATGMSAMPMSTPTAPPSPPPIMRVDRPFLVLIRDTETGTLLFAGVIRNPQS